ncbi:hypothetical protein ABW21_db0204222 [Orbilia brochopaga]|nr:hypothetical protein ABW21_db0204222 [Drechslerella brochopaga]
MAGKVLVAFLALAASTDASTQSMITSQRTSTRLSDMTSTNTMTPSTTSQSDHLIRPTFNFKISASTTSQSDHLDRPTTNVREMQPTGPPDHLERPTWNHFQLNRPTTNHLRLNTPTTEILMSPPKATPAPAVPPFTFWYNTTSDVPFTWIGPQYYAIPVFRGGKWFWPWGSPAPTPRPEYILWGVDIPWPPKEPTNTSGSNTTAPRVGRSIGGGAVGHIGDMAGRARPVKVARNVPMVSTSMSVETVHYDMPMVIRGRAVQMTTSTAITNSYVIGPVTTTTVRMREHQVALGVGGNRTMTTVTERHTETVVQMQTYRVYMGITTVQTSGREVPMTFVVGELVSSTGSSTGNWTAPTPTPATTAGGGRGAYDGSGGDGHRGGPVPTNVYASVPAGGKNTPVLPAFPTVAAGPNGTNIGDGGFGVAVPTVQDGGASRRTGCVLASCGHDRSLLYFRPLPQTPKCLCKTFKRLPPHPGLCPDCDRALKLSRGQSVAVDPLTPENRAKAQSWRGRLDAEVKDREAKRAAKERKDKETTPADAPADDKQAAPVRSKKSSEAAHKQRYHSRQKQQGLIDGVIPPFVPQPGETFLQHITAEVVDDAKSGGEMTRLLQALETGIQGFGIINDQGQESWLMASKDHMAENHDTMNIWTGKVAESGASAIVVGGPGYDQFFPALGKPTIGNPGVGIPMIPQNAFSPYGKNNTAPAGPGPGGLLQPQPSFERYPTPDNGRENNQINMTPGADKENRRNITPSNLDNSAAKKVSYATAVASSPAAASIVDSIAGMTT